MESLLPQQQRVISQLLNTIFSGISYNMQSMGSGFVTKLSDKLSILKTMVSQIGIDKQFNTIITQMHGIDASMQHVDKTISNTNQHLSPMQKHLQDIQKSSYKIRGS